jgi:hypothetical protein
MAKKKQIKQKLKIYQPIQITAARFTSAFNGLTCSTNDHAIQGFSMFSIGRSGSKGRVTIEIHHGKNVKLPNISEYKIQLTAPGARTITHPFAIETNINGLVDGVVYTMRLIK